MELYGLVDLFVYTPIPWVLFLYLWQCDKRHEVEEEKLKRLIVIEEAHRYLRDDKSPAQRGDRTLLELAIAEARSDTGSHPARTNANVKSRSNVGDQIPYQNPPQ